MDEQVTFEFRPDYSYCWEMVWYQGIQGLDSDAGASVLLAEDSHPEGVSKAGKIPDETSHLTLLEDYHGHGKGGYFRRIYETGRRDFKGR